MTFGPQTHPGQLGEADPAVIERVLASGSQRVTEINTTTRDGLNEIIAQGVEQGMGPAELGDAINAWSGWDEYRAEMIARTETGMAYNETALATYRDAGVEQVNVTDGDDDDICAPWANWTGPIDEAPEPLGHPNCTRDFIPVTDYEALAGDFAAAMGAPSEAAAQDIAAAPAAAAPEKTIAEIVNFGPPRPVSDAFSQAVDQVRSQPLAMRNPSYQKVVDKLDRALTRIGQTFRDGNLPNMPSIGPIINARSTLQGAYTSAGSALKIPVSLEFRANAQAETVYHEITHFIDQQGIGNGRWYGSELGFRKALGQDVADVSLRLAAKYDPVAANDLLQITARADAVEPVARAILDSEGYKAFQTVLTSGEWQSPSMNPAGEVVMNTLHLDASTRQWVQYALKDQEVFARAMAQYLVEKDGYTAYTDFLNQRVWTEAPYVGARPFPKNTLRALADQWTPEDFAPIRSAIDQMLRTLGWAL